MTNREKVFHLIEELPEYKLNLVLAYLQGLTAAAEAEEDLYCEQLYQEYTADPDRNDFVSLEQAAKELGIVL